MAMEYLHDHACPVENLRAGGVFEIACLAWRDLMIDDDEFRPAGVVFGCGDLRDCRLGRLKALAGLRLGGRRPSPHDSGPTSERRQFGKLSRAQNRQPADAAALLRHRPRDLIAKGLNQPAKLLEARLVSSVVNAIELNTDENCTRHRLFCFHGREISTNAQRVIGERNRSKHEPAARGDASA